MTNSLRVGIIGVSADRGWAREAHVPAIQALDGFELVAVATRNQETADSAAAAFDVARAYGSAEDLIADPEVDLVTVAASVPAHRDLILAALAAGKHVATEWPVGLDTEQTEEIAAAADRSPGRTAVGLQSRLNPAAVRAAELIESGAIGRVLSAGVYSTTAGFGPRVPEAQLYLEKPETGMNLMTIQSAHTVDFAIGLVGRLTSVAALATVQYPQLEVGDPPRPGRRTVPDHLLLQGRFADGGTLAAEILGGRPADDSPFRMQVVGEDGVLTVAGGAARGFQAGVLELSVDGEPVEVDTGETAPLPDSVVNVAANYAAFRDEIRGRGSGASDFAHATRLAHLLDDISASAAAGRTVEPTADWP